MSTNAFFDISFRKYLAKSLPLPPNRWKALYLLAFPAVEVKFSLPLYFHLFEDNWLKSEKKVTENSQQDCNKVQIFMFQGPKSGREVEVKFSLPLLEMLINKGLSNDLVEVEVKWCQEN